MLDKLGLTFSLNVFKRFFNFSHVLTFLTFLFFLERFHIYGPNRPTISITSTVRNILTLRFPI